ncbi:hypothetical protein DBR32_00560 [Taibaiella sp. KBW10]|uniref:YiiX/YebB-like N1pC/P60 family cysteine hydrolase n=1 Tax=Taibaiella sp. KBW10 TaxID=2153357 RepID=UPI000F5A2A54|nr:YiiX/YebB-like N1pC/P60 family cysteine hydrolase [Taibaiella sp. KBW10]RQO32139.1 hypothetical protein DBR32_00560 [Taibaiella sp. KBW10]
MKYLLLLLCSFLSLSVFSIKKSELRTGDLLFQNLDCGGMCDAIEAVTAGYQDRDFSHMGMVCIKDGKYYIAESIGKGVQLTPIEFFLERTKHAHLVGRLKPPYKQYIPKAVQFCYEQLGTAYDEAFLYDNGKYYCSELIYDAFKYAYKGKPFFTLYPMTYKDPETKQFYPVWVDYFKKLQMDIPEGLPGCNPGGMSTSDKLLILGNLE